MFFGSIWGVLLIAAVNVSSISTAVVVTPIAVIGGASAVKAIAGTGARRGSASSSAGAKGASAAKDAGAAKGASSAKAGGGSGNQGARVWARGAVTPASALAMAAPVVLSLAALGGPAPAIALTVIVVGGGGLLIAVSSPAPLDGLRMALAAFGPALACMSVVLSRSQGPNQADALVGAICAYDLAAFLMGNSRTALGGPIGVLFGWISIAVVAVFVASIMDPPFSGHRPAVLFGLVALTAPLGVWLADRVVKGARLPALRRLDSVMLAGPAWVIGVGYILHK